MTFRKKLFLLLASLSLSGCMSTTNIFNPASPIAEKEASLFWIVLAISLVVFLIVDGGLLFIIIRDRGKKGDNVPPRQISENRVLEATWTGIPVVLVIILFVLTVVTMRAVAAPTMSPSDVKVTVIGHRWWWEFDYPDLGIKTANELHIPAGTNVQINLQSVDVIHSFWVPQLSGKTDVVPGQTNTMWLTSEKIGEYAGQCAEFCGTQHADMRFKVVVESKADFVTWVSGQQTQPAAPTDALAVEGQKLVTQGACVGCHTINGTNAKGAVGPNLTHLFSRSTFAGSSFELNDQNLATWLTNSESLKPGNLMAGIRVPDQNVQAIIAYLHTLK